MKFKLKKDVEENVVEWDVSFLSDGNLMLSVDGINLIEICSKTGRVGLYNLYDVNDVSKLRGLGFILDFDNTKWKLGLM